MKDRRYYHIGEIFKLVEVAGVRHVRKKRDQEIIKKLYRFCEIVIHVANFTYLAMVLYISWNRQLFRLFHEFGDFANSALHLYPEFILCTLFFLCFFIWWYRKLICIPFALYFISTSMVLPKRLLKFKLLNKSFQIF